MKIGLKTKFWETINAERVDKVVTVLLICSMLPLGYAAYNNQVTIGWAISWTPIYLILLLLSLTYSRYKKQQTQQENEDLRKELRLP